MANVLLSIYGLLTVLCEDRFRSDWRNVSLNYKQPLVSELQAQFLTVVIPRLHALKDLPSIF